MPQLLYRTIPGSIIAASVSPFPSLRAQTPNHCIGWNPALFLHTPQAAMWQILPYHSSAHPHPKVPSSASYAPPWLQKHNPSPAFSALSAIFSQVLHVGRVPDNPFLQYIAHSIQIPCLRQCWPHILRVSQRKSFSEETPPADPDAGVLPDILPCQIDFQPYTGTHFHR